MQVLYVTTYCIYVFNMYSWNWVVETASDEHGIRSILRNWRGTEKLKEKLVRLIYPINYNVFAHYRACTVH